MRIPVIMKVVALYAGLFTSVIWGLLCFRYISFPFFLIFFISIITLFYHKNIKFTYVAFGLYFLTTVIPIDIRTPPFEYEKPMPTFKIIPLKIAYPTDTNLRRYREGELYLGGDVSTGLEPKWVLVWKTDLVTLTLNNLIDFLLAAGLLKI